MILSADFKVTSQSIGASLVKERSCRNALDQSRHLQERSRSFSLLIQERSRRKVKWLP